MTTPLRPSEISDRIKALQSALTPMQTARLTTIRDLLAEDNRFLLRAALEAGEFVGDDVRAQDAFRDFRNRVNKLAAESDVDLRLELDSRKTTPDQRYGWFAGNPVDRGLASFTQDAAEQLSVDNPVAPEVAELGESRRRRVYVSFHPTTGSAARSADLLIKKLTSALGAVEGISWDVADSRSPGLGEDIDKTRERYQIQADVCVSLISPQYLTDSTERRQMFGLRHKLVACTLSGLPHGPVDLHPLKHHEISHLGKPWDQLRTPSQRTDYINDLVRQIQGVVSADDTSSGGRTAERKQALQLHMKEQLRFHSTFLVPSELNETSLQESLLDGGRHDAGPPLRAVDRLVEWATDNKPDAPKLCALLGDVGMGKTTTATLFTQRLHQLHEKDPSFPMPLLFDLRNVRVNGLDGAMTLDRILDDILDATRPSDVPRERLNAAVVRNQIEHARSVIVFDGLDEVLVHLSPHDRQLFTRQLWRALPAKSPSKMLLTCRTQYFRTIRDQVTFFTGESRKKLRGNDYLALLMRPFRPEQVREYLKGNLGRDDEWVDRFLETIGAVHNLTELSQRPITLRLIADQVEFIETAKLEGRTLRSVDIYAEVVDRWIARDGGKHTLTPDHKRLLMEEIAAGLWRSGKNAWSPSEVDGWLLEVLAQRPDLRRHYRDNLPDLWTADFRTATFLKREGDTFQFAHRSLFEYFLARYLFRTLGEINHAKQGVDAVALPVPSPETLDFLGQSIAAEPVDALASLQTIGRQYQQQASELALAYALHAQRHGYPCQSLVGVDLAGAALSKWRFGEKNSADKIHMPGAILAGADLQGSRFHHVNLSGADLTKANVDNAEFHESTFTRSSWHGSTAVGAILRHCDIEGVDLSESKTYRTQLLLCTPTPVSAPGLLTAPVTDISDQRRLQHFARYVGRVLSVAWSPDGTHILTGSDDGTTRIWNATTGQPIHELTEHTNWIHSVAWSPDGTHILTGSGDNTTRIWNATTGQPIHELTSHTDTVNAVAWSPDSTHILTGSSDNTTRIWNATTGQPIHELTGTVRSVAWSPDSTHILTGSSDGTTRIWNATTGQPIHELTSHTGTVRSVAWSPDSTHILTGSDDGSAHIWDAITGQPIHELTSHTGTVRSVAWSPDSTHILTGSDDGTTRIWNATTGQPIHE
ncbi:pentapeptide repeat-containing protein, partial [Streptomyces sp. ID05-26A]|nr:pentapeptide repeat-containing protein [Streptomyces sp. ID05-26A]